MKSSATITTRNIRRYQAISRILAGSPGDKLESVLADLVTAFDLNGAGLVWPALGRSHLTVTAGSSRVCEWDSETSVRLASARSSDEVLADPSGARFLIPLVIENHRNGVFWAAPTNEMGCQEEDRLGLVLAAQSVARHPALLSQVGATDQVRVVLRLQDAALASGKIAHDFDNIFTGVVGFAEMTLPKLAPNAVERQYVNEILAAGSRGIQFTQQLHQLSRAGIARPMPASVGSVLASEVARVRKNANVWIDPTSVNDLPPVAVDSGSLQTVIGHLLDNAVEASPVGGTIRVTANLIELSDAEAREMLGGASAGPFVSVTIVDEGPGVKEEHRKKLFVEPFFTTKARHRGLGLPVVYRTLYAHRGGVRFETAPGRTLFQVVLPLAAARAAGQSPAKTEVNRTPGGQAS